MTTETKTFVPSTRDREAAIRIMKVSESDCYARVN
jgi:hypothetical protein